MWNQKSCLTPINHLALQTFLFQKKKMKKDRLRPWLTSQSCWHNSPPFFSTLCWLRMCYGLNSPSFVLRASGAFVFLPTSEKESVPSSLCRRTCSSSSIHPSPSIWFLPIFSFVMGSYQPYCRGHGFGLRKVTFAPPASWGKVNHIPPVFMFGVSWGSHLSFVWVLFLFVCLFGGGGISTISHSCFVESIAWIMLDAKAAAVTLTTFFEILSLPI